MNKFLLGFCVLNLAGLLILSFLFLSNREKVVFIDSAKVVNSYSGMIQARKEFQGKSTLWQANLDTLAKEIQVEITNYQRASSGMNAREKELSKELIKTKQKQFEEYQRALREKAQQEDAVATKKVLDEINAYIKSYGETHGYAIVLAATEQGNIAFAKEHLDITEVIIEGLNNKREGVK
jgi:outer membrane protein